jgi:antitoxin component YwqK of YwqJK toxin-antitoxin module
MKRTLLLLLLLPLLIQAQSENIKLIKFEISPCDRNADIFRVQNRIVSQHITAGIYNLSIGVIANCAGIHGATTTFKSDTLKIRYEEGSITTITHKNRKTETSIETAGCDCCFEFNFSISGITALPKTITVNDAVIIHYPEKYKTYPVTYTLKDGDTINLKDKYGFKQKQWFETKANNGYLSAYYLDDRIKTADGKEYHANGKLKSLLIQTDFERSREEYYFDNGELSLMILSNDTLGTVSTAFNNKGVIQRVYIDANNYNEEKLFYPDGKIKKITGYNVHQDYYPNGRLKNEFSFIGEHQIITKYYYPTGQLMATHWVDTDKETSSWKYYSRDKKTTNRQLLLKQGYNLED